jgi:AraC-like DNA-binding protein/mannose-6-phosphate isomerase-like protein (cupin superfamily)
MALRLNRYSDDAVSALLGAVKVHSTVYCVSDLRAPWGFQVEDSSVAKFHLVLEGACVLTLDTGEHVPMESGQLVLLPAGTGHAVRDRIGSRVRHLDKILAEHPLDQDEHLDYGGQGVPTRLLCGGFILADALPGSLLAVLPGVLSLDAGSSGLNRWLEPVFELLRDEVGGSRPGASAVFTKLADVFLAQVLREYLVGAEAAGVFPVAPFKDPAVARAVELVRTQPADSWTVASLAAEVGMSRTLFGVRFRELVGESPIRYLARVRLSQAAGYLTTTNSTLYAIAQRTGYESEASLSKAFKRAFGRSPGEYRRESHTRPIRISEWTAPRKWHSNGYG